MNYLRAISIGIEKYLEIFLVELFLLAVFFSRIYTIAIMIFGFFAVIILSTFIKAIVKEKRPKLAVERKEFKRVFRIELRSFPSSHSAAAAFFVGFCLNTIVFIPTLAFALLVMWSRVYIKSHYPRDVIAGGLLGFLVGMAAANLHVLSYFV